MLRARAGRSTVRAPATLTCWPSTVADRELVAVDVARAPAARACRRTSGPITGSPAKRVGDGDRVAVGVEQPAGPLDGRRRCRAGRASRNVAGTKAVPAPAGLVGQLEPDGAGAVRQGEGAGVPAAVRPPRRPAPAWSARKSSRARPANGVRTASRIVTVPVAAPAAGRAGRAAAVGRRGVDLADGVVELPHAGEAGGEGDVGVGQVGRLDQHPGGLRAPGPGQGERPGAELGGEDPRQVARRVADPRGPVPRPPRGRRRRRRSAASPGRRRRPRRPSRGCRASRRAGSACRRGSRPPGRPRRWGGR